MIKSIFKEIDKEKNILTSLYKEDCDLNLKKNMDCCKNLNMKNLVIIDHNFIAVEDYQRNCYITDEYHITDQIQDENFLIDFAKNLVKLADLEDVRPCQQNYLLVKQESLRRKKQELRFQKIAECELSSVASERCESSRENHREIKTFRTNEIGMKGLTTRRREHEGNIFKDKNLLFPGSDQSLIPKLKFPILNENPHRNHLQVRSARNRKSSVDNIFSFRNRRKFGSSLTPTKISKLNSSMRSDKKNVSMFPRNRMSAFHNGKIYSINQKKKTQLLQSISKNFYNSFRGENQSSEDVKFSLGEKDKIGWKDNIRESHMSSIMDETIKTITEKGDENFEDEEGKGVCESRLH